LTGVDFDGAGRRVVIRGCLLEGERGVDEAFARSRRRSLLEHFGAIKDTRQPCKVMYALPEVLLLVVCATIAS
jgi:hypothetical protein